MIIEIYFIGSAFGIYIEIIFWTTSKFCIFETNFAFEKRIFKRSCVLSIFRYCNKLCFLERGNFGIENCLIEDSYTFEYCPLERNSKRFDRKFVIIIFFGEGDYIYKLCPFERGLFAGEDCPFKGCFRTEGCISKYGIFSKFYLFKGSFKGEEKCFFKGNFFCENCSFKEDIRKIEDCFIERSFSIKFCPFKGDNIVFWIGTTKCNGS